MKYGYLLLTILLLAGCKKDATISSIDCTSLQQGLVDNDVALVDKTLGNLLNMDYSEENLNKLANMISSNCDINAALLCYDCVFTLPPQSEMSLKFSYKGDSVLKVIDLTHAANNKIDLLNIHE